MSDAKSENSKILMTVISVFISAAVFIIMSIVVIIKRHMCIRSARYTKAVYTPIGHGLPKNVRVSVEQEINATRRVYVEPKIFTEEYEENIDEYLKRKDITYIYRLKVVEEYKELIPLVKLFTNDPENLTKTSLINKEATDLNADCFNLYTNARTSYKPFTEEHYRQFSQSKERLLRIFTSRKNSWQRDESSGSNMTDQGGSGGRRLLPDEERMHRHSHSVDSIDSQTALIEIDNNRETHSHAVTADNSTNNLHDNLIGCVTTRFSKSAGKKGQDNNNSVDC